MSEKKPNNKEDSFIEHKCRDNKIPDCRVLYGPSIDPDWNSWILELKRTARRQDVIDGEAEGIGDLMCSHQIIINFCPFCGKELSTV